MSYFSLLFILNRREKRRKRKRFPWKRRVEAVGAYTSTPW